eukprot:scaffold37642_cov30-Tisochrysis_lutea.AAC.1
MPRAPDGGHLLANLNHVRALIRCAGESPPRCEVGTGRVASLCLYHAGGVRLHKQGRGATRLQPTPLLWLCGLTGDSEERAAAEHE